MEVKEHCPACYYRLKVLRADFSLRLLYCDHRPCERWAVVVMDGVEVQTRIKPDEEG